jgi:hypothetical protein
MQFASRRPLDAEPCWLNLLKCFGLCSPYTKNKKPITACLPPDDG